MSFKSFFSSSRGTVILIFVPVSCIFTPVSIDGCILGLLFDAVVIEEIVPPSSITIE